MVVTETDIARLKHWGKALGHETRVEVLIKLLEEEDRVEADAIAAAEAEEKVLSEEDLQEVFKGLSPSKLSKLVAPGLEKRRKKPVKKGKKHDPDLSSASYHIRELIDTFKLLELVKEVQVRGAMEHFYRIHPGVKETLRKILALDLG